MIIAELHGLLCFIIKIQVYKTIFDFLSLIENHFGKTVKCIRSDNGTEIIKEERSDLFSQKGIIH